MDETFKDIDELERLFCEDGEDDPYSEENGSFLTADFRESSALPRSPKKPTQQTNSFREKPKDCKITNFFEKSSVQRDPVFGLRIVNPLISSTVLAERMQGRQPIGLARLKYHVEQGDKDKDWVIAGVIVSKVTKVSQKGTKYTLWKISDLKNDIKMCSVMLFKAAHNDLWKTPEATVVAILNPGIMDSHKDGKTEATLSIDNTSKVMILGMSKDLGRCKSKTRSGDPCPAIVNASECEYCVFHVKQEYSKASAFRGSLQSATSGRGLNELRNKVLGKNEVFYGGQSYTAVPAKKNPKRVAKDEKRLQTLSELFETPKTTQTQEHQNFPALSQKQLDRDASRLALLKTENSSPNPSPGTPVTAKALLSTPKVFLKPSLSQSGFSFELNVTQKAQVKAKARAAELLKRKPIEKTDPNNVRGTSGGKKRALDDLNRSLEEASPDQKKLKTEEANAKRERLLAIINAKSSHTDLVEMREREIQDKYFSNLEKKEAMEEKMLATTKVECKAVICLKCKYVALSAAEKCREEKHPLKVKDAEKRFFKCKDCGNRCVSLQRFPKLACKSCQSSRWERTSMMREKEVQVGEKLSIRGDEETWIGSSTAGNINLLVPEESA